MMSVNRENEGKKIKTIAIIGRARGGKSFFTSRFVENRVAFTNLFCGNNSDKTVCPVHVRIAEQFINSEKKQNDEETVERGGFIFRTDFCKVFDKEEDLMDLRKRVKELEGKKYSLDAINIMSQIEAIIREIKDIEEKKEKKIDTYIETYHGPSEFCKEIMQECNLEMLEFVDTPGVSGKVDFPRIAKSDLYMFLVKPDNEDEAETLLKIVDSIKAEVATSKVAFLYKREGLFLTLKKYEKARNRVKQDMLEYSELFEDLKGNIISTQLDILEPASHCILFPTMDEEDFSLPEELFLTDIKSKLLEAFKNKDTASWDKEFQEILEKQGSKARELVFEIMSQIPKHEFKVKEKEYSIADFMVEKHDRVKTKDENRIVSSLRGAYFAETQKLYSYFSKFKSQCYPEEWQQIIVKYIYKKIMDSVNADRGAGDSWHHWEEPHVRTMIVAESVFADKVLDNVNGKEYKSDAYRKALQEGEISSGSWNYVYCKNDKEALKKLEIIKECLLDVKVYSRKEMVLCRYVGGLRKQAQYNILKQMGYSDEESMIKVKELPF